MIIPKKDGKPDLDKLSGEQRANVKHKKYRHETDDYEVEFWEKFEFKTVREEVEEVRVSTKSTDINGESDPITFESKKEFTIEFEFQIPFDPHSGAGEKAFLSISKEEETVIIAGLNFGGFTEAPYIPEYQLNSFQVVDGTTRSGDNRANQFDLWFNGRDAFSIRKLVPTSDDLSIKIVKESDRISLLDGRSVLSQWLFNGFDNLDSLITQMQEDLTDYEVKRIYSAGIGFDDLAEFSAFLVQEIDEWDVPSDTATGETIADSYPTYLPLQDLTTWRKFKLHVYPREGTKHYYVGVYVDDILMYSTYFNTGHIWEEEYDLHLNYDVSGTYDSFDAPIRNLNIYYGEPKSHRLLCVMNHSMLDHPETDGEIPPGGNGLSMTSGRFRRLVSKAKELGWEIIPLQELLQMLNGQKPKRDKVLSFTIDDNRFDYYENEAIRHITNEHNIKFTTCIVTGVFDWEANADKIQTVLRDGHAINYHCDVHTGRAKMSYEQFIADNDSLRSAFGQNNFTANSIVYASGSETAIQQKWYRANGFTAGFQASGGGATFSGPRFNIERLKADDIVPFEDVEKYL